MLFFPEQFHAVSFVLYRRRRRTHPPARSSLRVQLANIAQLASQCSAPVCVGPHELAWRFGQAGRVWAVRRNQPAVLHCWRLRGGGVKGEKEG
jgi:hypothetical protein